MSCMKTTGKLTVSSNHKKETLTLRNRKIQQQRQLERCSPLCFPMSL